MEENECYFKRGVLIIKPKSKTNTIHIKKIIAECGIKNALYNLSECEDITNKDIENMKMKGLNVLFCGIDEEKFKNLKKPSIIVRTNNELIALENFKL